MDGEKEYMFAEPPLPGYAALGDSGADAVGGRGI